MLHDGAIAEMKTGEGKTLVSTLAAYLNALTGEGVHGHYLFLLLPYIFVIMLWQCSSFDLPGELNGIRELSLFSPWMLLLL